MRELLGLTGAQKVDVHAADEDGPEAAFRLACKEGHTDVVWSSWGSLANGPSKLKSGSKKGSLLRKSHVMQRGLAPALVAGGVSFSCSDLMARSEHSETAPVQ